MTLRITHCICTGRSFADLLAQARREGLGLEGLMALAGQRGRRCGMCRPYLREALASGQTVFHEVRVDEGVAAQAPTSSAGGEGPHVPRRGACASTKGDGSRGGNFSGDRRYGDRR